MSSETVQRWLAERAAPVPSSVGSASPIVGDEVDGADVVGLGAAVRHASDVVVAMRAVLEDLIDRHGFRSLYLEGTDAPYNTGAPLDRYVVNGEGDPRALVAASQEFLRTREVLDVVLALRARNRAHPHDPVRIVHDPTEAAYSSDLASLEREIAERLLAWHGAVGGRTVYWGGAAHVLAGDPRAIGVAGPSLTHRGAGGHLRAALGERYFAVAATVGAVGAGAEHAAVPATPASFSEAALLDRLSGSAWVPLHDAGGPSAVEAWLDAPLRTRMIGPTYDPAHDPDHHVWAPSVRASVDAILYVPHSSACHPLAETDGGESTK